jgi:hypothetical protein
MLPRDDISSRQDDPPCRRAPSARRLAPIPRNRPHFGDRSSSRPRVLIEVNRPQFDDPSVGHEPPASRSADPPLPPSHGRSPRRSARKCHFMCCLEFPKINHSVCRDCLSCVPNKTLCHRGRQIARPIGGFHRTAGHPLLTDRQTHKARHGQLRLRVSRKPDLGRIRFLSSNPDGPSGGVCFVSPATQI